MRHQLPLPYHWRSTPILLHRACLKPPVIYLDAYIAHTRDSHVLATPQFTRLHTCFSPPGADATWLKPRKFYSVYNTITTPRRNVMSIMQMTHRAERVSARIHYLKVEYKNVDKISRPIIRLSINSYIYIHIQAGFGKLNLKLPDKNIRNSYSFVSEKNRISVVFFSKIPKNISYISSTSFAYEISVATLKIFS